MSFVVGRLLLDVSLLVIMIALLFVDCCWLCGVVCCVLLLVVAFVVRCWLCDVVCCLLFVLCVVCGSW